jgi:hypothetical protein
MVKVRVICRNLPVIVVSLILFQAQCSRSIYDKNPFHEFGGSLQYATMDDSLKDRYEIGFNEGYKIGRVGNSGDALLGCFNGALSLGGSFLGSRYGVNENSPDDYDYNKMCMGAWIGGCAAGTPLVIMGLLSTGKPANIPPGDSLYQKGFVEGYRKVQPQKRVFQLIGGSIGGMFITFGFILLGMEISRSGFGN